MKDEMFEANLRLALTMTEKEVRSAMETHGDFRSAHEGYAVILEELDELWDEVKKRGARRDRDQMTQEAKQVAAMGVKFLMFMLNPSNR